MPKISKVDTCRVITLISHMLLKPGHSSELTITHAT